MMLDKLKEASVFLCVKNKDGSFSPIRILRSDGAVLERFISAISKENPLLICTDVRLVELKKDKSKKT